MMSEKRRAVLNKEIGVEAYQFQGLKQRFPNHFHEYYVIGYVESGSRYLKCSGKEYIIEPGDLMIFNPFANHECDQLTEQALDYRCINIQTAQMKAIFKEITNKSNLPYFSEQVYQSSALIEYLKQVHTLIMENAEILEIEESYLCLMEAIFLSCNYKSAIDDGHYNCLDCVTAYLKERFSETISLETLSRICGLSKYQLIRAFTEKYSITPYRYLLSIRLSNAQDLLAKQQTIAETAVSCGFSDQSHLTNTFKKYFGISPLQYQSMFISERTNKQDE